ncbi:MAG: hypothetical protein HYY06_20135 [Deltaproteobacteria bacterium]|nr:hypothetical protein [Deltaproteobacteria bacterium]
MARSAHILVTLVASWGCGSEPCHYSREVELDASATPFESGASAFSPCERCPPFPEAFDLAGTAATRCYLSFDIDYAPNVGCGYGEGGHAYWSGGTLHDVPNAIDYCERVCPDEPYFNGCDITADPDGLEDMFCSYGGRCGED